MECRRERENERGEWTARKMKKILSDIMLKCERERERESNFGNYFIPGSPGAIKPATAAAVMLPLPVRFMKTVCR